MKKFLLIILSLIFVFPLSPNVYSSSSVRSEIKSVGFSGGSRTVTAVYVNLNDKTIRMESVLAKNQIGKVDYLKNIANQLNNNDRKVVGAINGTFFNAYSSKPYPSCTIETKGSFEFLSTAGSVIGFTGDNKVRVERLKVRIDGSINGNYGYPNHWAVYGFNNTGATADSIFTPAFGTTTGNHSKISIVVKGGKVIKIVRGKAPIPADGYTLVFHNTNYSKEFSVGDKVDYKLTYYKILSSGKKVVISWANVRTTVGAGPRLVIGSQILADGKLENLNEDKINTERNQRSFAGVTKSNVLVIGTVPDVNVKELAQILKKMGLINAINLDGGASSGLYYNGKYLTAPGRQLSNALVITKLAEAPLRVKLNSNELFYSNDPYLTKTGTSMVPLKQILNTFGCQLNTTSITAKRGDKTIKFTVGSDIAKVNGIDTKMGAAVQTKSGVIYVPLNFLIGTFGGSVQFDSKNKIASIKISIVNAEDAFNKAEKARLANDNAKAGELYLEALDLDSKHSASILALAKISSSNKEYKAAAEYYSRYFSINKKDYAKLVSSGWSYYSGKYYDEAQAAFKRLTELQPKVVAYWINLGRIYSDSHIKKYSLARQCFNKALTLNPTKEQKAAIAAALERIKDK
ncbi:MAG: phosphodiester glycosidase family protein [Clostridia bacterium]|jgi:tetratricopeptide (TPR) repeat protein